MNVAVLGAGGIVAPAIIADLAEWEGAGELTLLDVDGGAARRCAAAHGGGRAQAGAVDATDRQQLTLALEGCQVLVNAASYRVNLAAMDAALAAGCAYVDLGGLYHVAREQYAQAPQWEAAGLVAILGCGAGPGKTNVMAARAARELDAAASIRCASASLDEDGPSLPYALQTLRDELAEAPMVRRGGAEVALAPRQDGGTVDFGEPIGERATLFTLHSEPLTLGDSLECPDVDFRLGLMPEVADALISGAELPRPSGHTWSAQHVEATGTRAGSRTRVTVTALTEPHVRWGLGGGVVSTGTVAAAVVRMLADARIGADPMGLPQAGVFPPEALIEFDALAAELAPRGCRFDVAIESL